MFSLTAEQRLLVETTRRFLTDQAADQVDYEASRGDGGSTGHRWRRGADLGWSALLADTARQGRFADVVLLAREFGRRVAAGPLGPVNVVVAALAEHPVDQRALRELTEGAATATWVDGWSRWQGCGLGVTARPDGGAVVLDGVVPGVESVAGAGYLLVTCTDATTCLVPAATAGVSVVAMNSLDLHRDHGRVQLDSVRVEPGAVLGADPAFAERLLDLCVLVQLGETVGALEWAFDTTARWCADRYSFGRPLAAYQVIQHRMADMATWLEASRAITADAARSFDADSEDRSELVSSAKTYVGRYAPELLQECVQLHGGIGVTAEHELHRYLRRVAGNAATHGTAREHAARVGRLLEARVPA